MSVAEFTLKSADLEAYCRPCEVEEHQGDMTRARQHSLQTIFDISGGCCCDVLRHLATIAIASEGDAPLEFDQIEVAA
jgi:hypothetical protein